MEGTQGTTPESTERFIQSVYVEESGEWYASVISQELLEEMRFECGGERISGMDVLAFKSGKFTELSEGDICDAFNELDAKLLEIGIDRAPIKNQMVGFTDIPVTMTFFQGTHSVGRWPTDTKV